MLRLHPHDTPEDLVGILVSMLVQGAGVDGAALRVVTPHPGPVTATLDTEGRRGYVNVTWRQAPTPYAFDVLPLEFFAAPVPGGYALAWRLLARTDWTLPETPDWAVVTDADSLPGIMVPLHKAADLAAPVPGARLEVVGDTAPEQQPHITVAFFTSGAAQPSALYLQASSPERTLATWVRLRDFGENAEGPLHTEDGDVLLRLVDGRGEMQEQRRLTAVTWRRLGGPVTGDGPPARMALHLKG